MINLQGMLLGGAGIGIIAFGAGWQFHANGEVARTTKAVAAAEERVKTVSAGLIKAEIQKRETAETESRFAKDQVAQVNATIAKQVEEQKQLILADQALRADAATRTEKAAQQAAKDARDLAVRFQAGLNDLKKVADACARAPVDPDVRRLLDDLLGRTAS